MDKKIIRESLTRLFGKGEIGLPELDKAILNGWIDETQKQEIIDAAKP